MIPLVVGFIGGSPNLPRKRAFWISFVFAIGLAVTFVMLGIAAALVGGLLGGTTRIWYYLVAAVCFVIGLQMLGVLQIPVPSWFGRMRERVTSRGLWGAFLLGLVSGLVSITMRHPGAGSDPYLRDGAKKRLALRGGFAFYLRFGARSTNRLGWNLHRSVERSARNWQVVWRDRKSQRGHFAAGRVLFSLGCLTNSRQPLIPHFPPRKRSSHKRNCPTCGPPQSGLRSNSSQVPRSYQAPSDPVW